ncbi:hypothetical protein [Roseibium sp.]|uniref:hypothetical protein n=1 Tax=Roseibium sp. TaxID=1936156 RepID=UPI003B52F46F
MGTPDGGDVWVIATIIGVVGLFGGLVSGIIARDRAVSRQIREADDKLHERISRLREETQRDVHKSLQALTDYKLQVAQEYASVEHLKEVENRLVRAIEQLTAKLEDMPAQLALALKKSRSD